MEKTDAVNSGIRFFLLAIRQALPAPESFSDPHVPMEKQISSRETQKYSFFLKKNFSIHSDRAIVNVGSAVKFQEILYAFFSSS